MARQRMSLRMLVLDVEGLVGSLNRDKGYEAIRDADKIWKLSSEDQWPVLVDYADYLGVKITLGFGNRPTAVELL